MEEVSSRDATADKFADLGRRLAAACEGVIRSLDSRGMIPTSAAVARTLQIEKDAANRLVRAARCGDPFRTLHVCPGPVVLRSVSKGAGQRGVPRACCQALEDSANDFEVMITEDFRDRATLDAVLSNWIPEVQKRVEILARQSVFKGIKHIKGYSADAVCATIAFRRSAADPDCIDTVLAEEIVGLMRMTAQPAPVLSLRNLCVKAERSAIRRVDGAVADSALDLMLPRFCELPGDDFEFFRVHDETAVELRGHSLNPHSKARLAFASLAEAALHCRAPSPTRPRLAVFREMVMPTRLFVFFVLVSRELYPDTVPGLTVYDTTIRGPASINDRTRDTDAINRCNLDRLEEIGALLEDIRCVEAPQHREIVRYVLGALGWDEHDWRVFRVRAEFPLYGSQYSVWLPRPSGDPHG